MTLPKRTPEGYTVIFVKALNENMINYKLETFMKYINMVCMLDVYQNGPPNGHVLIHDIEPFPECYVPKMEYKTFKKYYYYDYEVIPTMHTKALHTINTNPRMDEIIGVMEAASLKSLLPFVITHKSIDDLMKYVPKECLPEDYGGLLEPAAVLHGKNCVVILKIVILTVVFRKKQKRVIEKWRLF
mgnify:CR=1 FL=1